jgi:hypothetical protein
MTLARTFYKMLGGWFLVVAVGMLCGCAVDSARPGTVCGHCDYRFSHQTPNPCDPCVRVVELPCFGYTPTTWHPWPEGCASATQLPTPQEFPAEVVPLPETEPTPPNSFGDTLNHPGFTSQERIAIGG